MCSNSPVILGPSHLELIEKGELHTQGEFLPFLMHDFFKICLMKFTHLRKSRKDSKHMDSKYLDLNDL